MYLCHMRTRDRGSVSAAFAPHCIIYTLQFFFQFSLTESFVLVLNERQMHSTPYNSREMSKRMHNALFNWCQNAEKNPASECGIQKRSTCKHPNSVFKLQPTSCTIIQPNDTLTRAKYLSHHNSFGTLNFMLKRMSRRIILSHMQFCRKKKDTF